MPRYRIEFTHNGKKKYYETDNYQDALNARKKLKEKPTNFMQSDTWENFWEVGGKHKNDSMGGVF